MGYRPTTIERAYMLAASGRFQTVLEVKQALQAEGYPEEGQLYGLTMTKQLSKLIAAAKAKSQG
jgi:hypothetical protein